MERLPTVFIDRDGTINIESGYINHPVNFRLYPFAAQAIRILNEHGIQVVVVTNQAGVGRGYFDENHVNMLHTLMKEKLKSQGAHIDALYYCPHHSSSKDPKYSAECDCRKPSPGMVNKALAELPVDRERMFVIGDRKGDMKLAENTGACGIMVRTGYGEGELIKEKNIPAEVITDNLLTAVYEVLSRIEQD
ncbi:D-glycero-alpha-D-manno-heptose-1,7-bisphosphate 7-phosphatase [Limisalsivibrio acetivorans]|uniref:D-glycero-alpha-D-manno-heptose-1,7-bisphosphate 7-phosphatase n=1 Tax=Limisalsivibrio acetivorans TaxID=1304888 RepID=UPI0003B6074F|nr:HAD family hydrolase [Limisalsivibrio acetivorans]